VLVLDSGDKIRGDASAATVVDYTFHGLDNNVLKQLADGQLPSSIGDLYTADSVDLVSTITLTNTDSVARTVNLYLTPSGGTARRLIPKDLSLGIGYSLFFDGAKCAVMDASGNVLTSFTAHASNHENGGSDEISVAGLSGLLADDQHVLDSEVTAVAIPKSTFTADGEIIVGTGAGTYQAESGATLRASIDCQPTDAPVFTGQATIPTINLTGGQIAFPATAVPSADPNTLDDYEKGTAVVAMAATTSGTITIDASYDTIGYVKVGDSVVFTGDIRIGSVSSPVGDFTVTDIPFATADSLWASSGGGVWATGFAAEATTAITIGIGQNSTILYVRKFAAGSQSALAGDTQAGAQLYIGFLIIT